MREEDAEPADAAKDADGERSEPDEPPRRRCPACKKPTLARLWQDPMPRLYDLMQLVLWPEQWRAPRERQALLPELDRWLPGGDEYLASVFAQLPSAARSGFT